MRKTLNFKQQHVVTDLIKNFTIRAERHSYWCHRKV